MSQQNPSTITKIQGPGTTMMKISGILMIVFSTIALILHIFAQAALKFAAAVFTSIDGKAQGLDAAFSRLGNAYLFALLGAAVTLIAGILALAFCRSLGKGLPVIIFCALSIILSLAYNIMEWIALSRLEVLVKQIPDLNYMAPGFGFSNVVAIVSSTVLPLLAMIGALKNNKAVQA